MYLVAGLGNPGKKYDGTPHNLGYEVLDILADEAGLRFQSKMKFSGIAARGRIEEADTVFLKPTIYMNLSGISVSGFMRYNSVELKNLLVITDDINLPVGRLRFRERGSHGGHKGLLSIIEHLGTSDFTRLRIGVRPPEQISDWVKFVLNPFRGKRREEMEHYKKMAADAVKCYLSHGFSIAASKYNIKNTPEQEEQ
jgi:peptidyl-tRNA hydrolase, PTH1 family